MLSHTTARRLVPALGTALLIGVSVWAFVTSPLPASVIAAEVALLAAVVCLTTISLSLRLGDRLSPSKVILIQGLTAVALCTTSLAIAIPYLRSPVMITVADFLAVITAVNPAAPKRVQVTVGIAGEVGLGIVWRRGDLITTQGIGSLFAVLALVAGAALLIYANWALLERHSEMQTKRLRAVADIARQLGLARDSREVAHAVLGGLHALYPLAAWGSVLIFDAERGCLVSLPAVLSPHGVMPLPHERLKIRSGEGITGTVFATGSAMLLRTRREIAAAYHDSTEPDRVAAFGRYAGGSNARCFLAAPLRAPGHNIIGVLVLNSTHGENLWDTDDLTTLEGIADQAAVAVERARLFEEQAQHANTDPLTRVGNRRAFEAALNERRGQRCALLAIDVDNLKDLNDEYGHEAGDMLLVEVARTLREHLRSDDLLARIGGDEFVAILAETRQEAALAVAERMRSSLHGIALPHGRARISVGVATGAIEQDVHALWLAADEALSRAKRSGRDKVVVATEKTSPLLHSTDAGAILDAVISGSERLGTVFQPIVDLSDRTVIGYEALARFPRTRDIDRGVDDIFSVAHRRGAMRDLDWACRRVAMETSRSMPHELPLFLNVSIVMLLDPLHPVDHMLLLSRWAGRAPESIVLEITEREQIPDKRRLAYVVSSYREHGFRFALDDVGEGHSTLELLAVAVPDYVKIAASITRSAAERGPRAVVLATTAFAASSNALVIAEGIEDERSAQHMAALGVAAGQGFWLGRPVPAQQAGTALLSSTHGEQKRAAESSVA